MPPAETPNSDTPIWVVIPAAGIGSRMGCDIPKQYLPLAGQTIIEVTIKKFLAMEFIKGVVITLHADDSYWKSTSVFNHPSIHVIEGGKERCDSVNNGLKYIASQMGVNDTDWVMVHDAARPCVNVEKVKELVVSSLAEQCGGILAVPASDTIKKVVKDHQIEKTEDRSLLWLAHTPQFFPVNELANALAYCDQNGIPVTDEASAIEAAGGVARVVKDRRDNIKVTVPEDLAWAEQILKNHEAL